MSLIPPVRRLAATSACLLLVGLVQVSAAGAHSAFQGSTPGVGQRVEVSPAQLLVRFNERLNQQLTRVDVEPAGGGAKVRTTLAFRGDSEVVVTPLRALPDGAYVVRWQAVSTEDGHPLQGTYSFGVRAAASAISGSVESDPLRSGSWVRIPFRVALYVSLLLFAAALLLRLVLPDRAGRPWLAPGEVDREFPDEPGAAATQRFAAARVDVGIAAASCAVAVLLVDTFDAAGSVAPAALRDYLLAGPTGLARVATVVLVAGAVWQAVRRPRVAALSVALAVGAVALSGHAGSAEPRAAAIANNWAHLLAGAVWLGGIVWILYAWRPLMGDPHARRAISRVVLPRFGRVALPAFVVVVVSGSVSAIIQLGEPAALWQSSYGQLLAAKIVVVGAIAALSYVHAFRLRPKMLEAPGVAPGVERRHWRLLSAEWPLALVVVTLAAVLVAFPLPPRQLDAADEAKAAAPACDPCPLRTPDAGELAVAAQAGRGVVAGWVRQQPRGVEGELRQFTLSGRPASNPLRLPGGGGTLKACGLGCTRFAVPPAERLVVERLDAGRWHRVVLPARWVPGGAARARRMLERTQSTMRQVSAVREDERVTSGPGTRADTRYLLRSPDRLDVNSDSGVRRIEIGDRGWLKVRDDRWRVSPPAVPFSVRTWYRWTAFAQAIELLAERTEDGRRVAEVAFFDPGSPSWQRLTIDLSTMRVVRGQTLSRAHFITQRFRDYDRSVRITAPPGFRDG